MRQSVPEGCCVGLRHDRCPILYRAFLLIGDQTVEPVQEFCYLGSIVTNTGNSDREVQTRVGKANSTFQSPSHIWRDKNVM